MSLKKLSAAFVVVLLMLVAAPRAAFAVPIVVFGNTTGVLATATGTLTLAGNVVTLSLTNTSPFDARITSVGFDILPGNDNGYSGVSSNANFVFTDADPGNVPQFPAAVIDFAYLTGPNFAGGNPPTGLAPGALATFTITDTSGVFFGGLTEQQIADGLFVRFQRVGADGEGSDVGRSCPECTQTQVPEPASMMLLGTGLLAAAAGVRRKKTN